MTDEQRDGLLLNIYGKVEQMHGVLYLNGLVAKIGRHEEIIREGHLTCPIGSEIARHLNDHKNRKYNVPVWVVVLVGMIGVASPFVERLVFK
jgi:hypothetical protein